MNKIEIVYYINFLLDKVQFFKLPLYIMVGSYPTNPNL